VQVNKQNSDWIWDRYWQHDRIASCYDQDEKNYPPAIKREWQGFFETLPDGANILDLCTGNGAIARIAAEHAVKTGRDFSITGVDRAEIKPEKFVAPTKGEDLIDFQGGVAAEDLPFKKAEFDAVVSQYGFEYTRTELTAGEISTALKPGGVGKLICHAAEGVPAAKSHEEAEKILLVSEELELFDVAKEATMLAWTMEKAPPEKAQALLPAAREKMQAFKNGMAELADLVKENPNHPFLSGAHGLLSHTFAVRSHFPLETLVDKIEDTKKETLAHLGRVEALLEASLSESDCRALKEVLESNGFTDITFAPFYLEDGAKLAGWNFEFRRLAKHP